MTWLLVAYLSVGYWWFWRVLRLVAIGDRPGEIVAASMFALVLWPVLWMVRQVADAIDDGLDRLIWHGVVSDAESRTEFAEALNAALALQERHHA